MGRISTLSKAGQARIRRRKVAMSASIAVVPHHQESSRPDIAWIRKNVPVLEVGKALGLRIRNRFTKCWRPENHAHGDADPSLQFYERGNRVRCFVCDMLGGHSNVDLVMGVLGFNIGQAVRWIAERFDVPNVKPGRPVGRGKVEPAPYNVRLNGPEFYFLIRTGMFGQLSAAERSILPVLEAFRDPDSGLTTLSYQAIIRYSGVSGRTTVSKTLQHLQRLHAIQIHQGARSGITRKCNTYKLTLDDPKFLDLCNKTSKIVREQIAQERSYRSDLRADREREADAQRATVRRSFALNTTPAGGLRPPDPPVISLSFQSKEQPLTYEGLNLSPLVVPIANKTVPKLDRKIGVSGETRRQILERQGKEIKAKYAVEP
jgi:hypothetical protein